MTDQKSDRQDGDGLRDRLEEERNVLDNSFGRGSWADGLTRDRIRLIDERLAALPLPTRDGAEGAGDGATEDALTKLLDETWPDGHRAAARKILSRFSISPAVAAEPETDEQLADQIHRIAGCHAKSERTAKLIAWYRSKQLASPPVRGDREALTNAIINNMPILTGLNKAVDAILSLPVQPGAGERGSDAAEADRYFDMAGEFGNRIQRAVTLIGDYDRHGSVDHAVAFELKKLLDPENALSHQAPHSSSETER